MSLITLFEYEQITNAALKSRIGTIPIAKLHDQITQLNEEGKVELIKIGHHGLQATQFVGVLRLGEITIQVLPKIDYLVQGEPGATGGFDSKYLQIETSTRNLLYLLSYAYDLPLHERNLAPLFHHRSDWFELLTRFFAESLHSQMRHGLDHTYVTLEDTLPVLRGRWLLCQQITRHPQQRLLFDVQYDEFLVNTPLNRIFRYVSKQLLVRSTDPVNRRMLTDICQWMADVERIAKPERSHLEQVIITRLNDRFRPSFNLARLFLEQSVIQLSSGRNDLFSFMFDMDRLFERFVGAFLVRHRSKIFAAFPEEIRIRLQSKGSNRYLADRLPEHSAVHILRPDILMENTDGDMLLIADTKYKHLRSGSMDLGVDMGDIYQLHAYGSAWHCPNELLIYPSQSAYDSTLGFFDVLDHSSQLAVATVNLHRPLEKPDALIQDLRGIFQSVLLKQEVYSHGTP